MSELPAQSDRIDVERIMDGVRARVAERARAEEQARRAEQARAEERARAEEQARLAAQAREEDRARAAQAPAADRGAGRAAAVPPPTESFAFDENIIYWSSRGGVGRILYGIRTILRPLVKFVFNIDPMVHALVTQARLNAQRAAFDDATARRLAACEERDARNRQAVQSLTAAVDRLAADMKSHRALVASAVERLDALDRARAGGHAAEEHGGGADGRTDADAATPAAGTPPPGPGQADGRTDADADASAPAAATPPPGPGQADGRTDADADASAPAAATPPPDR